MEQTRDMGFHGISKVAYDALNASTGYNQSKTPDLDQPLRAMDCCQVFWWTDYETKRIEINQGSKDPIC